MTYTHGQSDVDLQSCDIDFFNFWVLKLVRELHVEEGTIASQ